MNKFYKQRVKLNTNVVRLCRQEASLSSESGRTPRSVLLHGFLHDGLELLMF